MAISPTISITIEGGEEKRREEEGRKKGAMFLIWFSTALLREPIYLLEGWFCGCGFSRTQPYCKKGHSSFGRGEMRLDNMM